MSFKPKFPVCPLVSTTNVVYISGINSTGTKGQRLASDGYNCTVPQMPSENMTAICALFMPACLSGIQSYTNKLKLVCLNCTKEVPDLVVGSSQGGAIAMALVQNEWAGARLVLIAPAWKTFGIEPSVPKNTIILHGTHDWLVSPSDSEHLSYKNKCRLIKVDDNHHLEHSYNLLLREVNRCSYAMGQHKDKKTIDREWAEYKEACTEWLKVNCTKLDVLTPISLESTNV